MLIRIFDVVLSLFGITLLFPLFFLLYLIGLFETGSPLFIQKRVGRHERPFKLVKFRTMRIGTEQVGTHLAKKSDITNFGRFLRRSKLDEIPQLVNVLAGDMSFVGPRPGLPNQTELNKQRALRKIFDHRPGITGLGQINEIDMSTPRKLSRYDQIMNRKLNPCLYLKIFFYTMIGKGTGDRIK